MNGSSPSPHPNVIAVTSARADGRSSLALGIAGCLSGLGATLLVDLDPDQGDLAALLDVADSANVYHLLHRAQLGALSPAELNDHVRWHEGLAVLPGITEPGQAAMLRDPLVGRLQEVAARSYAWVVMDVGRARPELPAAAACGAVLWVVAPSPPGLAAFDRLFTQLQAAGTPWLGRVRVMTNRVAEGSLAGAAEFLERELGVTVVGGVPDEPGFWRSLEISHSLQALSAEVRQEARYLSWFGRPALRTRRALEHVVERLRADLAPGGQAGTGE